jgi:hypothetical protein
MTTQNSARRFTRRLSYSNVVATLALFIALGGVSWAAVKLPKNSVTTKSIKKGAVTNAKIKKSAVNSKSIKNKSIVGADIKPGTLTGTQINLAALGVVPAAATATDQFQVIKSGPSTASDAVEATARGAATEVPLVSNSQVSIYGKCFKVGTVLRFETYSRSTAAGSTIVGYSVADELVGDPSLSPSTDEAARKVAEGGSGPNNSDYATATGVQLLGTDAKGLSFELSSIGHNATVPDPSALVPQDGCLWLVAGKKIG